VSKYHLNRFAAFETESSETQELSWTGLKVQGAELITEKFEHSAAVESAEGSITTNLEAMTAQAAVKKAILEDDLTRNLFKEKIEAVAEQQGNRFAQLKEWTEEKLASTAKKETINSITDAQLQLSLLAAYESNKVDLTNTSVPAIKALNEEILTAEYKTDLSKWAYPKKDEIEASGKYIDDSWATLGANSAQKKLVLEDDLARETFREEIRLCNLEHVDRHAKIETWIKIKEDYLAVREEIDTIEKANNALSTLAATEQAKVDMAKTAVSAFTTLGNKIVTAEYKTDLSQWVSPDIADVQARETFVTEKWAAMSTASADKKTLLDAELAREIKKEELRLQIANLGGDFMLWSSMQLELCQGFPLRLLAGGC
jgi:hypothetical protein